jgi:hypothetical protein
MDDEEPARGGGGGGSDVRRMEGRVGVGPAARARQLRGLAGRAWPGEDDRGEFVDRATQRRLEGARGPPQSAPPRMIARSGLPGTRKAPGSRFARRSRACVLSAADRPTRRAQAPRTDHRTQPGSHARRRAWAARHEGSSAREYGRTPTADVVPGDTGLPAPRPLEPGRVR